ncbi:S-adenosyl-L-methionine-dependent methyltransferase [Annulohypoxylon maeteangense]|uniref:S-adenosyl-L-methionine-dependent methyltransferase n=1 Tax=Annulohypoxylon maeteangense TaxID=1927788 RepID=UPI0020075690|nr:S-adenosyl-L-methionine-dependent methyltransferase [Annulohypoxylon maeteangense]KAI0883171.1 S-adenosyl-L-methionine-dependent methyltransferase [Annulohypoxylon maeteangense]
MPRLPPSLLRRAHRTSPHLAALLPVCRDLGSARNELRWLREYVVKKFSLPTPTHKTQVGRKPGALEQDLLLGHLCRKRGAGVPLQYILGTQPFGDLEIKCRPGVLIPRPETEAWVLRVADIVRGDVERGKGLRVLDLCTGSGCIALLMYSLLRRRFPGLSVRGVDVETRALALSRENLAYNTRLGLLPNVGEGVGFERADIFSAEWLSSLLERYELGKGVGAVDILVSNPPYISTRGFNHDTERSVRKYEPKLALVPAPSANAVLYPECQPEDIFYARILDVAKALRSRFIALEVGDLAQGLRVVQMARTRFESAEIEIWRDWPDMSANDDEPENAKVDGVEVLIRGSGHGRAVFIRRSV